MLGQWRIVLRQAEESARAGRLDEALGLASRSDVADHRQAVKLRARLAHELVARSTRRAEADDTAGAIDDLDLAERHGAPPDMLAAARLKVADRLADEVRTSLDAGDPARALERIDALAQRHVSGPALRRIREAAEAWTRALDDLRRGEFGQAIDGLERAERLAGESARPALESVREDLDRRRGEAHPRVERLYTALGTGNWGETLAAAESVLDVVPEHPAARQARSRAWQQIGALNPTAALPQRPNGLIHRTAFSPAKADQAEPGILFLNDPTPREPSRPDRPLRRAAAPAPEPTPPTDERFLLWVDAVGGFLVALGDEIVLGRAGPESAADVPLLGDISRRHAVLLRSGDGYIIRAFHPTFVNGRPIESVPLRDGDVIRLGTNVELEFRLPSPISTTARLTILSRHRLPLAVDGVILMGETCILGGTGQAHVPAPGLDGPVVLFRRGDGLGCKAPGEFEVDGRTYAGRAGLTLQSNVHGEGFSFSLEPLSPKSSHV